MRRLGVISDTHGLLRPEAVSALTGVDHILHLGDVGTDEILASLRQIAPLTAVRGNNDKGNWARALQEQEELEIEGKRLLLLHDLGRRDFANKGFAAVISGHSHTPSIQRRDGVLFLNPGSAGPRRFKLPVSVAFLTVSSRGVEANLHDIADPGSTVQGTTKSENHLKKEHASRRPICQLQTRVKKSTASTRTNIATQLRVVAPTAVLDANEVKHRRRKSTP